MVRADGVVRHVQRSWREVGIAAQRQVLVERLAAVAVPPRQGDLQQQLCAQHHPPLGLVQTERQRKGHVGHGDEPGVSGGQVPACQPLLVQLVLGLEKILHSLHGRRLGAVRALVLHRDEMFAVVIQRADFGAEAIVGPAGIMQVAGVCAGLRIGDHAGVGAGRLLAPLLRVVATAAQARPALVWDRAQR